MEKMHRETQGSFKRGCDIRVGLVGVVVSPSLESLVLSVGTLHVIHSTIRVSLVDQFRPCLKLQMEAFLSLVIVLARVMVSL